MKSVKHDNKTNQKRQRKLKATDDSKSNKAKYIVAGAIIGAIALVAIGGFLARKAKSKKAVQFKTNPTKYLQRDFCVL